MFDSSSVLYFKPFDYCSVEYASITHAEEENIVICFTMCPTSSTNHPTLPNCV